MGLKKILKKSKTITKVYNKLQHYYYCMLTIISPKLNTKVLYKKHFGKKIDLKAPKALEEKLSWLKIYNYNKNPLVFKCADKLAVRDYVKSCGYESILNDLYYTFKSERDIDWDSLPSQFVLKWNFGAGFNIVCKEKSLLNERQVKKTLKKWKKVRCGLSTSELQYSHAPKRILCEKYLCDETQDKGLIDYKVYCFNGKPKAIFVMHDREVCIKTEFFTTEWVLLQNTKKYESYSNVTSKPDCLKQMLDCAEKLSSPFPFVRCDFYIVNNCLYFGEMTFTPAGGLYLSKTEIDGKDMSEFLTI